MEMAGSIHSIGGTVVRDGGFVKPCVAVGGASICASNAISVLCRFSISNSIGGLPCEFLFNRYRQITISTTCVKSAISWSLSVTARGNLLTVSSRCQGRFKAESGGKGWAVLVAVVGEPMTSSIDSVIIRESGDISMLGILTSAVGGVLGDLKAGEVTRDGFFWGWGWSMRLSEMAADECPPCEVGNCYITASGLCQDYFRDPRYFVMSSVSTLTGLGDTAPQAQAA
ncbi:hypothetical protein BOVATA_034780 [Babesia ovata]|uniref:Uncharacterized protein n=1 Tax=Babesia ovata TaxID=189622 RepID=A0A2H6KG69_9APIC|nr:uncharacterized protein BOVATA_034780 [Babesia ovata]GBE61985.1 hypothetical protein BOVATA_034780 [Babesia ovata]